MPTSTLWITGVYVKGPERKKEEGKSLSSFRHLYITETSKEERTVVNILALIEVKVMAVLEMLRGKQRSQGFWPWSHLKCWRSLEKWHDIMEIICNSEFLSSHMVQRELRAHGPVTGPSVAGKPDPVAADDSNSGPCGPKATRSM